jgi:hypothetical protein
MAKCSLYEAAQRVAEDIQDIADGSETTLEDMDLDDAVTRQRREREELRLRNREKARIYWGKGFDYRESRALKYLQNRGISLSFGEPNIRFHVGLPNLEAGHRVPALVLKVSKAPNSELEALHRIYLNDVGTEK